MNLTYPVIGFWRRPDVLAMLIIVVLGVALLAWLVVQSFTAPGAASAEATSLYVETDMEQWVSPREGLMSIVYGSIALAPLAGLAMLPGRSQK